MNRHLLASSSTPKVLPGLPEIETIAQKCDQFSRLGKMSILDAGGLMLLVWEFSDGLPNRLRLKIVVFRAQQYQSIIRQQATG